MGASFNKQEQEVINKAKTVIGQEKSTNIEQTAYARYNQLNSIKINVGGTLNLTMDGVSQSNTSHIYVAFDDAIEALESANADTSLISEMQALQDSKAGLGLAANSSNQKMLNDISTSINQKTAVDIVKSCKSEISQQNVVALDAAGDANIVIKDINQTNEAYNDCLMKTAVKIAGDAGVKIAAESTGATEQKATGYDVIGAALAVIMPYIIGLIVVVVLIFFGLPIFKLLFPSKKSGKTGGERIKITPDVPKTEEERKARKIWEDWGRHRIPNDLEKTLGL